MSTGNNHFTLKFRCDGSVSFYACPRSRARVASPIYWIGNRLPVRLAAWWFDSFLVQSILRWVFR